MKGSFMKTMAILASLFIACTSAFAQDFRGVDAQANAQTNQQGQEGDSSLQRAIDRDEALCNQTGGNWTKQYPGIGTYGAYEQCFCFGGGYTCNN
jgi:hypothetical protein